MAHGQSLEGLVESHLRRLSQYEWDLLRTIAIAGALSRKILTRLDVEALERLERSNLVGRNPCKLLHPLYREVIRGNWSVRRTGDFVRSWRSGRASPPMALTCRG